MNVDDHHRYVGGYQGPAGPIDVRKGQRTLQQDHDDADHADCPHAAFRHLHRRLSKQIRQASSEQEGGDKRYQIVDENETAAQHDDVAKILTRQYRRRSEEQQERQQDVRGVESLVHNGNARRQPAVFTTDQDGFRRPGERRIYARRQRKQARADDKGCVDRRRQNRLGHLR